LVHGAAAAPRDQRLTGGSARPTFHGGVAGRNRSTAPRPCWLLARMALPTRTPDRKLALRSTSRNTCRGKATPSARWDRQEHEDPALNPDNGVTQNFMPHLWMFLLQALTPSGQLLQPGCDREGHRIDCGRAGRLQNQPPDVPAVFSWHLFPAKGSLELVETRHTQPACDRSRGQGRLYTLAWRPRPRR